jgi:hypothetical protein
MMEVCLIPPKGLESFALHSNTQLALAMPELLNNGAYVNVYDRAHRGGDYIIVDNGEAEGVRVSPAELFYAARVLHANEIVIPDVIGDWYGTIQRAKEFFEDNPGLVEAYDGNMMYVAQGKSRAHLEEAIRQAVQFDRITTIGLPRNLIKFTMNQTIRIDVANWVERAYGERFKIHLLGVSAGNLKEIKWASQYAGHIRSIDSSMPFNYAIQGRALSDAKDVMREVNRPDKYFERNWNAAAIRRALIIDNINTFKGWAGARKSRTRAASASAGKLSPVPAVQFGDEVRSE